MSAIMMVITSVVLVSNGRFGGVVQLESLAYDVALSIRQAQVYGISVARFGQATFSAGYGVHFDTSNPNTFTLFADAVTRNGIYECATPTTPAPETCELVATTDIANGFGIEKLCVTPVGGSENCSAEEVTSIDVVFIRPEPDALISASGISCVLSVSGAACQQSARIALISPRGDRMSVVIDANGQISVRRSTQ